MQVENLSGSLADNNILGAKLIFVLGTNQKSFSRAENNGWMLAGQDDQPN